jgi:hypothetical protein
VLDVAGVQWHRRCNCVQRISNKVVRIDYKRLLAQSPGTLGHNQVPPTWRLPRQVPTADSAANAASKATASLATGAAAAVANSVAANVCV